MLTKIKHLLCRHRVQYPSRIGQVSMWQCARCSRHTDPIPPAWYTS